MSQILSDNPARPEPATGDERPRVLTGWCGALGVQCLLEERRRALPHLPAKRQRGRAYAP